MECGITSILGRNVEQKIYTIASIDPKTIRVVHARAHFTRRPHGFVHALLILFCV